MSNHKPTIAIVGGGRWGQVTLSVLAAMKLPLHQVMVSNANYNKIKLQLDNFTPTLGSFSIVPSLSDLFANYKVNAAIVVNSASQHFNTANELINKGISVLIEKPVVLTTHQAETLIEKALMKKVILTPGLCYRFCSYIHNFAAYVNHDNIPANFELEWLDTNNEIRYQQVKTHDTSINVAQEIMPHIWTILAIVFKSMAINIESCHPGCNWDSAQILVSIGNIHGKVFLNRNAQERKRTLAVTFKSGKQLAINFSAEPGTITQDNHSYSGDLHWETIESPLTQQLKYFLSRINDQTLDKNDIESCLQSVKCTEAASTLLEARLKIDKIGH